MVHKPKLVQLIIRDIFVSVASVFVHIDST